MTRIYRAIALTILIQISLIKYGQSAAVMSIDLGHEWMKVGVVSPGVPMEMALNKESKRKTPSVITFRDGIRSFGEDAENIGVRFPANSYAYLLDLLGKTIDNPVVKLYQKRFPYYEIVGDPKRNTVVFRAGDNILFSIEELIAQLLQKGREFAQDFAGQPITECVIVVPGYFGQAERQAIMSSAKMINLKVLQLQNDYTAVALNYGIFRRKEINETAQYFMFYDMGAAKTSAVVVSYQLVKDKATRETNPVAQIIGVGYERNLGGLEMQLRLRDHLAKEFNNMKKTKIDVTTNPRAMAKLFKEAGRVKNVLSANTEHYAQIEGLIEELDFKVLVTRDQFELMCADLFAKVAGPLERALSTAGLTLDVINTVVIFGGGTRVPKVQELLKEAIKQELGKNLNADEAAAMGAAYRAADLATGFKVKKFLTKDAVLFPLQVVFEREGESGNTKLVRRTLFGPMNPFPQKKVITFNKHLIDFNFDVNYADLEYLQDGEIQSIGSLNLTRIALTDVSKIINANKGDNVESKGIKAHFAMDDSGIFTMTGAELVIEKLGGAADDDDESPLSKLGSTISKLFSSDKEEDVVEKKVVEDDDKTEEAAAEDVNGSGKLGNNETHTNNDTTTTGGTDDGSNNKTDKPKIVTIKEVIPSDVTVLYSLPLEGDSMTESMSKVKVFDDMDRARERRENALNRLETYAIDAVQKLGEKEYLSCATKEEADAIKKACTEVSEWLYEDGTDADAITYEKKLDELYRLTNDVFSRHWEHTERPDAIKALEGMIDGAQKFYKTALNLTKDANPDKDVFTEIELQTLDKAIFDTVEWKNAEVKEQKKIPRNQEVRLTVKLLTDKMSLLDREVKYLVNKIKIWKPKVKDIPKEPVKKEDKTTIPIVEETQEELPILTDDVNVEVEDDIKPSETVDKKDDDNHTEL